jgi:hypothetical protein
VVNALLVVGILFGVVGGVLAVGLLATEVIEPDYPWRQALFDWFITAVFIVLIILLFRLGLSQLVK